jgi:hypothetical protein
MDPLEQGKEGAILLHHGIMVEQGGHHRLVKEVRSRYHNTELLMSGESDLVILYKRSFSLVKRKRTFFLRRRERSRNKLLALL